MAHYLLKVVKEHTHICIVWNDEKTSNKNCRSLHLGKIHLCSRYVTLSVLCYDTYTLSHKCMSEYENMTPLLVLRLLCSRKRKRNHRHKSSQQRVTATFIVLIVLFFSPRRFIAASLLSCAFSYSPSCCFNCIFY